MGFHPISICPTERLTRNPRLCFVLMPFAPQFQIIYTEGIQKGVWAAGLQCQRADDIMQPGDIIAQIWRGLMEASYVVDDLSGTNGNVLYELGLAHVIGHQAILLTQSMADVPLDLR